MRWLFSGRNTKLETINRILTDAARKRTERIKELETQVERLERQVVHLKQELVVKQELIGRSRSDHSGYAKRIAELEQHNQQLVEAANKYALRIAELEQHNQQLVEAANKYALRIQELENEFTRISKLICKSGDDPTSGA